MIKPYDIGDLFLGQPMPTMGTAAPAAAGQPGPAPAAGPAMAATGTTATTTQQGTPGVAPKEAAPKKKAPPGCFGGGTLGMLLPLVLMFVVFYFFLIRPQQKKQKEMQSMLGALRKGDQIITSGGMMGRITGLTDQYAVIEVQEKVRVKILRSHIAGKQPGTGPSDVK